MKTLLYVVVLFLLVGTFAFADNGLDNSLVAYWNFDEGNGRVTYDGSVNGNNGKIFNALWLQEGKRNSCLKFNGSNSFVAIANSNSLSLGDNFTIQAWVYWEGGTWDCIIGKNGTFNLNAKYFGYNNGSSWQTLEYRLPLNRWTQVTAVKEGADLSVYLDGKLAATKKNSFGNICTSKSDITIGTMLGWSNGWSFHGSIDELRIWDKAIDAGDIEKSYTSGEGANSSKTSAVQPQQAPMPVLAGMRAGTSTSTVIKAESRSASEKLGVKISKAEIKNLNGAPTIFVDGNPVAPMGYTIQYPQILWVDKLAKAGIHLYFLKTDVWPGVDTAINYGLLDNSVRTILSADPSAI